LQKKIKYFLKRKKVHKLYYSSNKNIKQTKNKHWNNQDKNDEKNLIIHNHNNQYSYHTKKSSSKTQNFKSSSLCKNSSTKSNKNDSSPKNKSPKNISHKTKSPQNKTPKNTSSKNQNINSFPKKISAKAICDEKEKNLNKEIEICKDNYRNEASEEKGLFIQILKPTLLEMDLFKGDVFRTGAKIYKNVNDPRNSEKDNLRKSFPKIMENQCSYIGEWMNGKRDGFGLLSLENGAKYLGYFFENKVEGYGHLWKEKGDSYNEQWKNYQAEGWGIYHTKSGANFRGDWKGNKQNGFGVERWPKGSIFLEIIIWEIKMELVFLILKVKLGMKENLKMELLLE